MKLKILILFILIMFVVMVNNSFSIKDMQERHVDLLQEIEMLNETKDALESELETLQEEGVQIHIELEDIFPDYKEVTATITGYTKECGYPWDDGITSTGVEAVVNRTAAVDPNYIPLGSLLYVPGYGFFVAEDIGGAVKGWHVDLYTGEGDDAYRRAMEIGRQKSNIIILT